MQVRTATDQDYDALGQVMFRSIRDGDSPYTQAERAAWIPKANAGADWADRLRPTYVVLAEQEAEIVGFMTVDTHGYIDLAYILPSVRGQGVFGALYSDVESMAYKRDVLRLTTHASLMAQPAFAHYGFSVLRHEAVIRAGQTLLRAEMEKVLSL